MTKKSYKRVLLKLSGEALQGSQQYGFDPDVVYSMAKLFKDLKSTGLEVAVVIGGGNIFRGLSGSSQGMDRATGDYMGMLATVINGLALFDAFRYHGERPLQLESTGAAVLGVLQLFYPGLLLSESGYGSSNVRLIEPDLFWLEQLFLRLQGPVVCLGLLGAMAKLLRGMRRWSQAAFAEQTLRGVCLVLVLYMVSGRVFSPQYLTWILPLGLFLSLRVNAWLTSLFVVILVLSQLLWQVIGLAGLDVWKMSLLLSRNVGLALWALALFCSPTEQTSRPASPKPPTGPPPQAQRRTKRCAQWVDRGMRAG